MYVPTSLIHPIQFDEDLSVSRRYVWCFDLTGVGLVLAASSPWRIHAIKAPAEFTPGAYLPTLLTTEDSVYLVREVAPNQITQDLESSLQRPLAAGQAAALDESLLVRSRQAQNRLQKAGCYAMLRWESNEDTSRRCKLRGYGIMPPPEGAEMTHVDPRSLGDALGFVGKPTHIALPGARGTTPILLACTPPNNPTVWRVAIVMPIVVRSRE